MPKIPLYMLRACALPVVAHIWKITKLIFRIKGGGLAGQKNTSIFFLFPALSCYSFHNVQI